MRSMSGQWDGGGPAIPVFLNGRFTTQPFSGVQRFASEITAALDRLWTPEWPSATLLLPPAGDIDLPGRAIKSRKVGRLGGQLWEQFQLPLHVRGGVLINLGNTAPLATRRQLVVIHDAGIGATPEAYSFRFRAWNSLLRASLARRQVRIATVSMFSRGQIARALGLPEASIGVIPEGADHMRRVRPDAEVLSRHGLQPRRYVLAVGNLSEHKNLSVLGRATEELARRGAVLAFAGSLESQAFRKGAALPALGRRLGRVTDGELCALYENAACLAFPSRYEGFGLPPLEAMSRGCPVVASSVPAIMETCGEAARFCPPDAPEAFAMSVCEFLENPILRADYVRRGFERVREFSWDRSAHALLALLPHMSENRRAG